ncbi:MAG: dCTP deaminase [Betaproteobacteria bacterium]|nr:dCTP deaminase [Betaproteobacteria bacterium]
MRLLTRNEILASLSSGDPDSLFLDPVLSDDQIGSISVDLRLGYDFSVSILTRRAAIEPFPADNVKKRGIQSYFQETRRRLGERFVLYPHQVVLSTTVEFLALPKNIYADISIRSSYGRLGIGVSTSMQPGWRGTVPLELFNHGNTPIEMVVGSCVCQARFYEIDQAADYVGAGAGRKYYGTVRPAVSKADHDEELAHLDRMGQSA